MRVLQAACTPPRLIRGRVRAHARVCTRGMAPLKLPSLPLPSPAAPPPQRPSATAALALPWLADPTKQSDRPLHQSVVQRIQVRPE
jgi:hypothetical protein